MKTKLKRLNLLWVAALLTLGSGCVAVGVHTESHHSGYWHHEPHHTHYHPGYGHAHTDVWVAVP
jgi:hypothetical protein